MRVLVVGASGATGRHVVNRLLERDVVVAAILRDTDVFPNNPKLVKIHASVHELSVEDMSARIHECTAVVFCLGHNMSLSGMFGQPKLLVTESLQCVCEAIKANKAEEAVKIILMSTTGVSNMDLPEVTPRSQEFASKIFRFLLPPFVDNEMAVEYLRSGVGQDNAAIEWIAVRPDDLTNKDKESDYDVHESPTRNPIFDSGETSRINVASFMIDLLTIESRWDKWKGKMPVIYNHTQDMLH